MKKTSLLLIFAILLISLNCIQEETVSISKKYNDMKGEFINGNKSLTVYEIEQYKEWVYVNFVLKYANSGCMMAGPAHQTERDKYELIIGGQWKVELEFIDQKWTVHYSNSGPQEKIEIDYSGIYSRVINN